MVVKVDRVILRQLGPERGPAELAWIVEVPGEGLQQTREAGWAGYLVADYTTEPEDDDRPGMVAVLVRPSGAEEVFHTGGLSFMPNTVRDTDDGPRTVLGRQHSRFTRVDLDLPERGEYALELREARLGSQGYELAPDAQVFARITFRRV